MIRHKSNLKEDKTLSQLYTSIGRASMKWSLKVERVKRRKRLTTHWRGKMSEKAKLSLKSKMFRSRLELKTTCNRVSLSKRGKLLSREILITQGRSFSLSHLLSSPFLREKLPEVDLDSK
jgi:hypothetical protein